MNGMLLAGLLLAAPLAARFTESRDVYPAPATPELKKDYEEWLAKHKK